MHPHRIFLLLAPTALVLLLSAGAQTQDTPPPNIVLILADDQSWNGTSVAMDPDNPLSKSDFYQTPHLEALAAGGMRFSDAYSAAAVCSPTRAALQTGRSPAQLQFTDIIGDELPRWHGGLPLTPPLWQPIDSGLETMPRRVKQANSQYVTGHIGKWHLEPSEFSLGFDYVNSAPRASGVGAEDPGSVFARTDAALSFINDRVDNDEPFFMQISHFAVHSPIEAQAETIAKYEAQPPGEIHDDPTYAAFTEALDTAVGMVVDEIDQLGLSDNTYIIYASDNGGDNRYTNNEPLYNDKTTLWEGGVRVPLIIRGPGIEGGSVSSIPTSTVDLYSTVSDLAGNASPLPDGVEGASLRPILENAGALPDGVNHLERQYSENGALFFHSPHNLAVGVNSRTRPTSSVRQGDYKLVLEYGERTTPDNIFLFNLAENISESNDPNSSLNLADEMPEKRDELLGLLKDWLQLTDASLAYDVSAPTHIAWRADQPGQDPEVWRAYTDVDQKLRETWEPGNVQPQRTTLSSPPHQPGLSSVVYDFNGNDSLVRKFFHVSDAGEELYTESNDPMPPADNDRSVSFEFWTRFSHLEGEQILFESGERGEGLSITLGDADQDGVFNDLRFRLLGDEGRLLTVTAPIDQFADPVGDFVHIAAVFNDSPDDRYAEVYLNGARIGRSEFLLGDAESIDWDGYDSAATIGAIGSVSLGASNGDDDQLPFGGGGFAGEISEMHFFNSALTASDVAQHYNSVFKSTGWGVLSIVGDAQTPTDRPVDVTQGAFVNAGTIQVIHERSDLLDGPLEVDLAAQPGVVFTDDSVLDGGLLPTKFGVNSFLLHFDRPEDDDNVILSSSITFAAPILGLILTEEGLAASDATLGTMGRYDESGREWLIEDGALSFSPDRRTLNIGGAFADFDFFQIRVITAATLEGDFNGDGIVDLADHDVWLQDQGANPGSLADANFDGVVDQADYDIWSAALGATIYPLGGDFNLDGRVDALDYEIWRQDYGTESSLADGNFDGIVDAKDYVIWRNNSGSQDEPLLGDFNQDGAVDSEDYDLWRSEYGTVGDSPADANGDGVVDGADYAFLQNRFGAFYRYAWLDPFVEGSTATATGVPEPSALLLGLLAATALFRSRQRQAGRLG